MAPDDTRPDAAPTPDATSDEAQEEPSLEAEVERLKAALAAESDRRLRGLAEAENLKKRLIKEKEEFQKYATESLIADLLPVLDHLELALAHGREIEACKDFMPITAAQAATIAKLAKLRLDDDKLEAFAGQMDAIVTYMGGRPLGCVLGLVCPEAVDASFWDGVLAGLAEAAAPCDLPLVGGDLSRGDKVGLAVTLWGRPAQSGRFLTRGPAHPGDVLFAVGPLGLARAGLFVLERDGKAAAARFPVAVAAHLHPRPRLEAGTRLAAIPGVTACLDVSDGLARDLPRLLAPGTGAELAVDRENVHPEAARLAAERNCDPVLELVAGGEDYALLGAVSPDDWPTVARTVPEARRLGSVRATPGLRLNGAPLTAQGFDHFG